MADVNNMKLDAHWLPFTDNKAFRGCPRLLQAARGMFYETVDGHELLDMTAGLWCSNLGHGRRRIADAIHRAACRLDYAPSFSHSHPAAFELAERLARIAPGTLNHVFFTSSGSEAVDTALKIALACHVAGGRSGKKMFISRERAYHGVNFGGTAAGGIPSNTRTYGRWTAVDHLPHTLDIERNAFSRGVPRHGAERAEALVDLVNLHGAENIAAVIVEPIAGAGGVIVPPAGYLKRLREICDEHGLLLIFDEVVCAFGRVGSFTAAEEFGVLPDMICSAKGLTSGTAPMGAVFCSDEIYDSVMAASDTGIEFWHGYTYSAHPIACAAALACLEIYEEEGLFTRVNEGIGRSFEDAAHGLRDLPGVVDVRNYGLLAAIEFAAGQDGVPVGSKLFAAAWERGLLVRGAGNCVILSPPLVIEEAHLEQFARLFRETAESVSL